MSVGAHTLVTSTFESMLSGGDPELLRPILHPQLHWGNCRDADTAIRVLSAILEAGMVPREWNLEALADRVVLSVSMHNRSGSSATEQARSAHFAALVDQGLVTHLIDAPTAESARTVGANPSADKPTSVAQLRSMAAVLPCRSIDDALAHYSSLGFATHSYQGNANYGYASRDGVNLHLAEVVDLNAATNTSAVYLYVDDAHTLHAEWVNSGAGGRFDSPENTAYGLSEGAHIDPDGNLIRYGSPI